MQPFLGLSYKPGHRTIGVGGERGPKIKPQFQLFQGSCLQHDGEEELKSSFADAEYTLDYILSLSAAAWGGVTLCRGGGGSRVPLKH